MICHRLVVALLTLLLAAAAQAHPLGQNAWNREAAIVVAPDHLRIDYLLDLAEIPTLAAGDDADRDDDGQISETEWAAHAERWAAALPTRLSLGVDGAAVALTVERSAWALAPGESGLNQLRLLARLRAPFAAGTAESSLRFNDASPPRLGWREVSVSAEAGITIIASDAPAESLTASMTDFSPRPDGPPAVDGAEARVRLATVGDASNAPPVSLEVGAKSGALRPTRSAQQLGFAAFFQLVVHHIAIGWDHLVFLLGLVLLSGSLSRLAWTVTAFTVAHSLTLLLAARGLVTPPGEWVEPLIAASIAWVGYLALKSSSARHGPWLAFGFGLIHGFGFAGALGETLGDGSTPTLVALLGFNLGIECFQLLLVVAVAPLLRWLARQAGGGWVQPALAGTVLLAGGWWFFDRTLGGDWLQSLAALALVGGGIWVARRSHVAATS